MPTPAKHIKTGTTIVGLIFKDGVILGADTRATGGNIVGDKNCEKLHNLAPNIYCAGAGTAADCDHTTEMIKRELELHRLNTNSESRVQMAVGRMANHLFRYGGHVGLHTIVGGVDCKGPQLVEVQNDGNNFANCYLTMGSGCLSAMGIFESEYKENMDEETALNLVRKAVAAGQIHDLGSGHNTDCIVIKKGKTTYHRNIDSTNEKLYSKPDGYKFDPKKMNVLREYNVKGLVIEEVGEQAMQLNWNDEL